MRKNSIKNTRVNAEVQKELADMREKFNSMNGAESKIPVSIR